MSEQIILFVAGFILGALIIGIIISFVGLSVIKYLQSLVAINSLQEG